jgi:DNA-binding response OmpR family regulator
MNKVMVVDDDIDILEVVKIILEYKGFEVKTTLNISALYNDIFAFNPNVILLDVRLGGYDGREICENLKRNTETKTIPVILFSAHAKEKDILQHSAADDFLEKPFEMNQLTSKINKWVRTSAVSN